MTFIIKTKIIKEVLILIKALNQITFPVITF